MTIPAITTTVGNSHLLSIWAIWNSNRTIVPPAGMTSRINDTGASPTNVSDEPIVAIGSTGPRTATVTTPLSWVALSFALKPGSL
jgi:hypothetical protein